MDVNGMMGQGGVSPATSPVARTPAPVPRVPSDSVRVVQSDQDSLVTREPVHTKDKEQARPAIDVLEAKKAASTRSGTHLYVDESTDRVIAQIVNANNEVIKQIPPEEFLKIVARFRNVVGTIFDLRI